MAISAFTYGTLMSEKVLLVVLGRIPDRIDAKLKNYSQAPIRGQCYPAVFKTDETSAVNGKVLVGLSERELEVLDAFEDPAYDRAIIEVETIDGEKLNARVWARPFGNVEDLVKEVDWNYERFQRDHEESYVERCSEWAEAFRHS